MATQGTAPGPNPMVIFDALNAYQITMSMKGALELDLFTHIAEGAGTAAEIAKKCSATERGVRILCDFLTIHGLLNKAGFKYSLPQKRPYSAIAIRRRIWARRPSSCSMNGHFGHFQDVAASGAKRRRARCRQHGTGRSGWVEFAESMGHMIGGISKMVGPIVTQLTMPSKVLDIAAGHGLFGIEIAALNPGGGSDRTRIGRTCCRWRSGNAEKAGARRPLPYHSRKRLRCRFWIRLRPGSYCPTSCITSIRPPM